MSKQQHQQHRGLTRSLLGRIILSSLVPCIAVLVTIVGVNVYRKYNLMLDGAQQRLGLQAEALFADPAMVRRGVAAAAVDHRTELGAERDALHAIYERLRATVAAADPTLRGAVDAREASAQRGLERLERSLLRAARRRAGDRLAHLDATVDSLRPGGVLQERQENMLPLLSDRGASLLELLQRELDPLEHFFTVLVEA